MFRVAYEVEPGFSSHRDFDDPGDAADFAYNSGGEFVEVEFDGDVDDDYGMDDDD